MDEIIGGWEVTGIVQWHSGFPQSPGEGFNFATDFYPDWPRYSFGAAQVGHKSQRRRYTEFVLRSGRCAR